MAIDTVVTGIELAADKPSPERRMASIKRDVPSLRPVQEIRILLEALRKLVEAETVEDGWILQVGLSDEFFRRTDIVFFLPVDRNLRLRHFCSSILRHTLPPHYRM